jgi:hypothetical protein
MTRILVLAATLVAYPASAEFYFAAGATTAEIEATVANVVGDVDATETGAHLGFGVRRGLERGDIGMRIEIDDLGEMFLAVRALDYRHHISDRLSFGAFFGAARLDLATPAYGYYLGAGVHFRQLLERWELGVELRRGDEVARDTVLPSDPQGPQPDSFYDVSALSISLSYRF